MPRKTATNLFQLPRHLTLVVVFLCTFLFSLNKLWAYSAQAVNSPATTKVSKKLPFSCKTKSVKGKIASAKAPQKRISLEGAISLVHITFQPQTTAWQGLGLIYFFVPQKQLMPVYLARPPSLSFISRLFPTTIQPNAP